MPGSALNRLFVFLLLALSLDALLGAAFTPLFARTLTGERGGLLNLALSKDADVLVLGSSRAQFHVVSSILSKRLGGKVYNAGLKGHDLVYASMLTELWLKRHKSPRAIVLTVDLETMIFRDFEVPAAHLFAPYLGESERVREVLYQESPFKRLEFLSRAYRFNGIVFPMIKNLRSHPDPAYDGYLPAEGLFKPEEATPPRHGLLDVPPGEVPSAELANRVAREPFTDLKVRLLRALASDASRGGSRLILVHPPVFDLDRGAHDHWLERMRTLVAEIPGVELIDLCEYAVPETFTNHPELYKDFAHLNVRGAELFSKLLADRLAATLGVRLSGTSGVAGTVQ